MNKTDILKKIIEQNGSCSWVETIDRSICSRCPIASMKQREDGSFMSCLEATGVASSDHAAPYLDVNAQYKRTAERLLLDASMEELLREESDAV